MYVPVKREIEYDGSFSAAHNIRFFNITKWVTDKKENSLEKLVNVYQVLSDENCNIALVFNRTCDATNVFLAVVNTDNADDNVDVENYRKRLAEAIRGNFPGAEWTDKNGTGVLPCLKNSLPYSVASASNIPGEKSEKFISQTIEKLLDGIVPDTKNKEYTIILLATPINDVENRKLHLAELYSALAPYAGWQTNFVYTESSGTNSMATFGLNAGVSAGIQQGQNSSVTNTSGTTDSTVLEEAHNILRRTSFEQSSEGSNLTGKSVEMISNAIAEMRTYGEGFIIVDQAPGLLDMSAIRNTNTKSKSFTANEIDTYKGIAETSMYTYARRASKAMPYFQITEPFIAGNDFFEMVDHYLNLLQDIKTEMENNKTFSLINNVLEQKSGSAGFRYTKNLFYCALGQFTRNYTQTVKRAADNKRRYAPGWVHSLSLIHI